ncbi:sugar MFS transporter [Actinophytocola sp.]|uniref:MFS transporter n=1 Tax=Actinophytocola sp. TaxID=1872138 RepID=UPI0025C4AE83|nr:MFS transporter [Actinophytocola sp.]
MVLFGLLGLFQSTLGPLIPIVRDDNGLTGATAGLLVSGFFAGSLASTVIGGVLTERWARAYLVVGPAVLLLLGSAGLVVRGPWPLPLLAVLVAGLGFGGLVLVVNTAMASQPGQRGVTLTNVVNGVFGLGAAAGPALVGVTRGVGYPYLFGVLAVAILLTLPARDLGGVRPRDAPPAGGDSPAVVALFCALLFCYAGLETGLSSWETVHLEAHGYAPGTASALTSLFWLGMAASRLAIPLLTAGRPPARIIAATLTAAFCALALIAVPDVAPAGYLLAGALAGPVFPTALAWHASTHPDPRRGNAVLLTAAMIGNVTLPAAIGYSMQATSELALPALVAVPVAVCLTITLVLRHRAGRAPSARSEPGGSSG